MLWAWVLWSPCALGTRKGLRLLHGWGYYLGMDALVTGVTAWAWMGSMLWSPYALGTRTGLRLGHGWDYCSSIHELRLGHGWDSVCFWNTKGITAWGLDGIIVWAWMLWSPYALGTRTGLWLGHGWDYGLGMDVPVTVCTWNMNVLILGMHALVNVCC